jgi:hypothetical protein
MGEVNLAIIGASGGVAAALLKLIAPERSLFKTLLLVDMDERILRNPFLPHEDLAYTFVRCRVDVRSERSGYVDLLKSHGIDLVLDLSTNETEPMLETTDALGVSYVNTGIMNSREEAFMDLVLRLHAQRSLPRSAPHILGAGMNPGVVNLWVRGAVERFGSPRGIVHFEYDTAQPLSGWAPIIAWSRETFLDEIVNDPAGYMAGINRPQLLHPNPVKHRSNMRQILKFIMDLPVYPKGFLLLHEENITLAQTYDVPSRFLFALHPRTMDYLEDLYDRRSEVPSDAMILGDNWNVPLQGSATVGVRLEYGDRLFYAYNTTEQGEVQGCSGSCLQVASGVRGALLTLMQNALQRRVHFVEDLFGSPFEGLVKEHLPTVERWFADPEGADR